jgi:hypothetical protein
MLIEITGAMLKRVRSILVEVYRIFSLGFVKNLKAHWWNSSISSYIMDKIPDMWGLSSKRALYCARRGMFSASC